MVRLPLFSWEPAPVEVGLLTALSIAADIAKAALPVVIGRTIMLRAWMATASASLMLVAVVALSLASGMGFAALTRSAATSAHQSHVDVLVAAQRDVRALDTRIEALPPTLPVGVIEAELIGRPRLTPHAPKSKAARMARSSPASRPNWQPPRGLKSPAGAAWNKARRATGVTTGEADRLPSPSLQKRRASRDFIIGIQRRFVCTAARVGPGR